MKTVLFIATLTACCHSAFGQAQPSASSAAASVCDSTKILSVENSPPPMLRTRWAAFPEYCGVTLNFRAHHAGHVGLGSRAARLYNAPEHPANLAGHVRDLSRLSQFCTATNCGATTEFGGSG